MVSGDGRQKQRGKETASGIENLLIEKGCFSEGKHGMFHVKHSLWNPATDKVVV
jgi:hypothetical protein